LTAEQVAASATVFKCCPPIREAENRDKLWKVRHSVLVVVLIPPQALQEGVISQVVSDHSPCTIDLKNDDFLKSWGGIGSLGLGLSIIWTEVQHTTNSTLTSPSAAPATFL
jgi:allantoinase